MSEHDLLVVGVASLIALAGILLSISSRLGIIINEFRVMNTYLWRGLSDAERESPVREDPQRGSDDAA